MNDDRVKLKPYGGGLVGWLVWTVEIAHSFQIQYAINRPDFGPFSCYSNQPPIKEGSLVVDETLDTGDGTTQILVKLFIYLFSYSKNY